MLCFCAPFLEDFEHVAERGRECHSCCLWSHRAPCRNNAGKVRHFTQKAISDTLYPLFRVGCTNRITSARDCLFIAFPPWLSSFNKRYHPCPLSLRQTLTKALNWSRCMKVLEVFNTTLKCNLASSQAVHCFCAFLVAISVPDVFNTLSKTMTVEQMVALMTAVPRSIWWTIRFWLRNNENDKI